MNAYQSLILITLFIGFLLIAVDYSKMTADCTRTKIIYKYIPRTFREEQESPINVSELFSDLFSRPSPFIGGFALDKTTRTDLNKYFISQG